MKNSIACWFILIKSFQIMNFDKQMFSIAYLPVYANGGRYEFVWLVFVSKWCQRGFPHFCQSKHVNSVCHVALFSCVEFCLKRGATFRRHYFDWQVGTLWSSSVKWRASKGADLSIKAGASTSVPNKRPVLGVLLSGKKFAWIYLGRGLWETSRKLVFLAKIGIFCPFKKFMRSSTREILLLCWFMFTHKHE